MMATPTFLMGDDLLDTLCEALGIEKGQCSRIVLDVDVKQVVKARVFMLADEKIEALDWKIGLTEVEPE